MTAFPRFILWGALVALLVCTASFDVGAVAPAPSTAAAARRSSAADIDIDPSASLLREQQPALNEAGPARAAPVRVISIAMLESAADARVAHGPWDLVFRGGRAVKKGLHAKTKSGKKTMAKTFSRSRSTSGSASSSSRLPTNKIKKQNSIFKTKTGKLNVNLDANHKKVALDIAKIRQFEELRDDYNEIARQGYVVLRASEDDEEDLQHELVIMKEKVEELKGSSSSSSSGNNNNNQNNNDNNDNNNNNNNNNGDDDDKGKEDIANNQAVQEHAAGAGDDELMPLSNFQVAGPTLLNNLLFSLTRAGITVSKMTGADLVPLIRQYGNQVVRFLAKTYLLEGVVHILILIDQGKGAALAKEGIDVFRGSSRLAAYQATARSPNHKATASSTFGHEETVGDRAHKCIGRLIILFGARAEGNIGECFRREAVQRILKLPANRKNFELLAEEELKCFEEGIGMDQDAKEFGKAFDVKARVELLDSEFCSAELDLASIN